MRETRETNEAQHASLCASALRALLLRNWTYLQAVAIDANLHQQATYTDALWRVAYTQELSGASQQAFGSGITSYAVTTNQYDPTGALRQITDPQGHVTTITDDALGRQIALQDPNRGAETASYDPNGNVTQTADARGGAGTINAGYDGLNRQLWRNTTPSASGAYVTYGYDSVAGGNQGKGRLTSESFTGGLGNSLSGSYASTYDSRGRLTQQSQTTGNLTNCPTGWTCVGVSNPTVKGNQFYSSDGVWTVQAAGHGIGTTSDSFQYNYQSLPGDGVLSAQVTSQTVTNAYAKSGIMLRATTDPGSPFYDVVVRPQGVQVQYRATSGAASVAAATVSTANVPIYLQITRSGTTFSAATSPDGVTWTPIANSTIAIGALTGTLLEGLAATSNDLNRLGASTFAHVSLSATAPAASTNSTHYTYNDDDQLASETYPNGDVVTTTYSAATGAESGLNLTPSGSSTATGLLSGVTYSGQAGAAGLVTGATLGAITTGTATFNASYDGLLRLTDKQYRYTPSGGSASTLYETQPSYDAVDNVVGVTTTLPQGTDHQAFCYD